MSDPRKNAQESMEQQDAAALAALGMLSPRDAMGAARESIAAMSEAAALVAESVAPAAPASSVRSRLIARVADYELLKPIADVRRDENTWIHSGMEGIDTKLLFREGSTGRSTYLVRMAPGSRMAPHHHGDVEQCLVIEGDIRWGSVVFEAGDFMVMGKDTTHPEVHTVNGVLMLIISGHNDFQRA